MLKTVCFFSGLKRKQVKQIEENIFVLREDKDDEYPLYFKLFDNVLFPILAELSVIRELELSKEYLLILWNNNISRVTNGTHALNLGLAQYFQIDNKQIKELQDKYFSILSLKQKTEDLKHQQKKENEECLLLASINTSIDNFYAGLYVSNEQFLLLLKHFDIPIPLKTGGYIKKKVVKVNKNQHTVYGRHSSISMLRLIEQLVMKINEFKGG